VGGEEHRGLGGGEEHRGLGGGERESKLQSQSQSEKKAAAVKSRWEEKARSAL
jgi:hypothetical protein